MQLATPAHSPKQLAEKVVNSEELVPVHRRFTLGIPIKPKKTPLFPKGVSLVPTWLAGVARSRIDKDDLKDLVHKYEQNLTKKDVDDRIDKLFPRMEDNLRKRFQYEIRVVSVLSAFLVAVVFQVSTPALLQRLSTEPQFRAQYLASVDKLRDSTKASLEQLGKHEDVSDEALRRLQKEHPTLAGQFEEASGKGNSKRDVLAELDLILSDLPEQREAILEEYELVLDELYMEQNQAAVDALLSATGELATLDIEPWAHGSDFYVTGGRIQWANVFGVLLTALLLTFGAPFWFERLQDVAKLRDALSPPKPKEPSREAVVLKVENVQQ